jgi:hypothetical protein
MPCSTNTWRGFIFAQPAVGKKYWKTLPMRFYRVKRHQTVVLNAAFQSLGYTGLKAGQPLQNVIALHLDFVTELHH